MKKPTLDNEATTPTIIATSAAKRIAPAGRILVLVPTLEGSGWPSLSAMRAPARIAYHSASISPAWANWPATDAGLD